MIYANFLYFIIAILVFASAPQTQSSIFSPEQNFFLILIVFFTFVLFNRQRFLRLRLNYEAETIDLTQARRGYSALVNLNTIISVGLFVAEVFIFDLKFLLLRLPVLGSSEALMNVAGLALFLCHLIVVWYWAFRSMGEIFHPGSSAGDFIKSNVKFNLVIVLPWLILWFLMDFLLMVKLPIPSDWMGSAIFQAVIFALFLFALAIFAPVFIVRLWDCEPLPDSELKQSIISFCNSQGVKFRGIYSWNALNKSLITAAVVGLFNPFRYLLITPGLMGLLDENEILAVVSHEVGHVKKRHMFFYLLFFIGFVILSFGTLDRLIKLILSTPLGFDLVMTAGGQFNTAFLSFLTVLISLFLFIVYFRFIFGYFMRNFERQADLYCFQSGIDPRHMISSFKKLGQLLGDEGKKSNWHHYNIEQRIGYIESCMREPEHIGRHRKKVKGALVVFLVGMIAFSAAAFNPSATRLEAVLDLNLVQKWIERDPDNSHLFGILGDLYYQAEEWVSAKDAWEKSLTFNDRQPGVLNNLAWLLLKCPDKGLRNGKRALELARNAATLDKNAQILDTLAEAYYENGMYKEAYIAAKGALALARENFKYFRDQLKKMERGYLLFRNTHKI
jgi:Zn-dependent protease with chaperone function